MPKSTKADGVPEVQAPDTEALQWAVKTLRFLMPGTPVGPHAAFENAVAALGVALPVTDLAVKGWYAALADARLAARKAGNDWLVDKLDEIHQRLLATDGVTAFQPLAPAHVADPRGPEFTRINQHDAIVLPAGVALPRHQTKPDGQ